MIIEYTPKQQEAMKAVQSEKFNFILYGGAIRGGKSFWGLSTLLILCRLFPKSRWCVIREDMERIRTTTIPTFKKLMASGHLRESPYEFTHKNGSVILFKGENYDKDKDLDWMKGLEVNGFLFEEINECQKNTLQKAFQRSGAWIIPNSEYQPKPIVLATCNPSFGWVKEDVYDKWETDTLPLTYCYIPATIEDNPHLPQEYLDALKNLNRFEYEVFVKGNWNVALKTGGEFLKGFELEKHVKPVRYNPNLAIYVSIDSNVYPYISISFFQVGNNEGKYTVKQFHEINAKDPFNTAKRAGELAAKYLLSIEYNSKVFICGDRSTKSRNTISDDKLSFAEIFMNEVSKAGYTVIDKFDRYAPSVNVVGDFVNSIFDGTLPFCEIIIGENCKLSIGDYIDTKQDKDGSILKTRVVDAVTKISYEPNGHRCDCLKDFMIQCFSKEFEDFQNRFLKIAPGGIIKNIKKHKYTM
jgi:hypothetical protein